MCARGIDFGRYSDDYAAFRPGFPRSFYDRLEGIIPIRGVRALDLGCGPGTIALELAARGGMVEGIDVSPGQIGTAARVAVERGLKREVRFRIGRAERTGVEGGTIDLVTAGSAWHWFDRKAALAEIRRVLRPGGIVAIASYAYLARHSELARETEDLILRFNPSWTMAGESGVHPEQIDEVIEGGFRFIEAFAYDHDEEFSHAGWVGRMRACNGVGAGLDPAEVSRFEEALRELLAAKGGGPLVIPHRVWCVVARKG